jgi:hypothetical protein
MEPPISGASNDPYGSNWSHSEALKLEEAQDTAELAGCWWLRAMKKGHFFWTPRNEEIKPEAWEYMKNFEESWRTEVKNHWDLWFSPSGITFPSTKNVQKSRWKFRQSPLSATFWKRKSKRSRDRIQNSRTEGDFTREASAQMGIELVKQWWYPAWSTVTVCELENGHRNSGFSH